MAEGQEDSSSDYKSEFTGNLYRYFPFSDYPINFMHLIDFVFVCHCSLRMKQLKFLIHRGITDQTNIFYVAIN